VVASGIGSSNDIASDITLDDFGNVYVTGTSDLDFVTIKYSNDGEEQWVGVYDNPGTWFEEGAVGIAVDQGGDVYVAGISNTDYTMIKYDPSGSEQWVAYIDPGTSFDTPFDMKVDGLGNTYVTGMSYSSSSQSAYVTIKYNSDGVEQWIARFEGEIEYDDPPSLAIDGQGNTYVCGTSDSGYT
jgi:hypothetical protein